MRIQEGMGNVTFKNTSHMLRDCNSFSSDCNLYKVSTGRFDVFLDLSVACSIIGISETQNLQMDLHWRDLAKGLVISKTGKIFTIAGFLFLVLHLAKSVL